MARTLLLVAVLAVLSAGGWGFSSFLGSPAPPARIGETVRAPGGGHWRVDAVLPEHMAPMRAGGFAASGMSGMSSTGMDMAPEGKERFAVEVTLSSAESGPLSYSAEDFRVSGDKLEGSAPIRDTFQGETLPAGGVVSGMLVFQTPEGAEDLRLALGDGRPVALDLTAVAPDSGPREHDDEHGH